VKKLAVIVTSPPNSHLTKTAYNVINQALLTDIKIVGVFFYQSGVLNASRYLAIPSDEYPIMNKWETLNSQFKLPLYLCSTAAEKHGLIDEADINSTHLIRGEYTIAGLGELVELTNQADRVLQL